MKKFSPIKERIRLFAEKQGIKLSKLYEESGISDGTFSNTSDLKEENLLKVFSHLPDINAHWLITGQEAMLKTDVSSDNEAIAALKKVVALLEKENERLQRKIADLEKPFRAPSELASENEAPIEPEAGGGLSSYTRKSLLERF